MYAKININTDGIVYSYASCNFNNKKLGQLRPRAKMRPAGWGSTPSQPRALNSRTTELVEVSRYWPTPQLGGEPAGKARGSPSQACTNSSPESDAAHSPPTPGPKLPTWVLLHRGSPRRFPQPLRPAAGIALRTRLRSARPSPTPSGSRGTRPGTACSGSSGLRSAGNPFHRLGGGGPKAYPCPGG